MENRTDEKLYDINDIVAIIGVGEDERRRAFEFHVDRGLFDINNGDSYMPFYHGTGIETKIRGSDILQRIISVIKHKHGNIKSRDDEEYAKLALVVLAGLAPMSIVWHGAKMIFWMKPAEDALAIYKTRYCKLVSAEEDI